MPESQNGYGLQTKALASQGPFTNSAEPLPSGWVAEAADMLLLGTTWPMVAAFKRFLSRLARGPAGLGLCWAMIYLIVGVAGLVVEMEMTHGLPVPTASWVPAARATLVTVQMALAGAAIPILLFVIGVAREDSALPMAVNELLVRDTQVLAVLAFGLAGVVQFVVDSVLPSDLVLFWKDLFFVCLWSVLMVAVTYMSTLHLLVQPTELAKRSVTTLTRKMEGSLRHSATVRVARALAANGLQRMGIGAGRPREKCGSYVCLEPFSEGVVTDLNLGELAELASSIRAARPVLKAGELMLESPETTSGNAQVDSSMFLAVSVGDHIDPSRRAIFYVPAQVASVPRRKEWERRLRAALKIKKPEAGGPEVEFAEELAMLRDNLVVDLRAGRLATLEKGLRVVTELALAFAHRRRVLEERVRTAAPATFESLLDPYSHQAPQWWDFVDELFEESLVSQRFQFIRLIHGYPASVAWRALTSNLPDLFEEAIDWLPRLYRRWISRGAQQFEDYIVDHTWRLILETVRYQILPEIEDWSDGERNAALRHSLLAATKAMAKLLKMSFDSKRQEDFRAFARAAERIRAALQGEGTVSKHTWDEDESTVHLPTSEVGPAADEPSGTRVVAAKYLELSFLALDGWITHKFDRGMIERDEYLRWRSALILPQSMRLLWELAIQAEDLDAERALGWDWWELEEHEEGTGFWSDFTFYLLQSVTVRSLGLLARAGGVESNDLTVPAQKALRAWAAQGDSAVERWLRRLEEEPEKWESVAGGDVRSLVPQLRERIRRALAQQEREELGVVIGAPISRRRVASVQQEIIKAWNEAASVRAIFGQSGGVIERHESAPQGTLTFGYNVLEPREAYIETQGTSFPGWGEHFGHGLGASENQLVVSALISAATSAANEVSSGKEFTPGLEAALKELAASGCSPSIMLIDPPWWLQADFVSRLEGGRGARFDAERWYCGEFLGWPVARLHLGHVPTVLLVDFGKAASWRQYRPRRIEDEDEILGDDLLFRVTEINEERARDLLSKQPDLAGQGESDAQAVLRLRAKVSVRVFETFEFRVVDPNGIRILRLH